ncbi:hypothetical protein AMS68_000527 [Peltaster fructicola]|uniref:Potassium transporter n=1 Tax=Peltaster fructicola TaxID=286661 RepID=A0A6H0XKH0_9PEZI|nr:hypothetical protein AMS68_000527 [Peltaster fructicola]
MSTGITFVDNQLRPVKTHASGETSGVDTNHGIVFGRTVSIPNSHRGRSFDFRRRGSRAMTADEEDPEASTMPSDYKVKQVFHGAQLFWLAYQSIGVIYGDIGTSPLYVFSSVFSDDPSNEDLVGILSIVIWELIIVVTLKYIIIILNADNEGEGGTFSTYSLLARYANITNIDPKEDKTLRMERYKTNEIPKFNRKLRNGLENSLVLRGLLKTIGVLAVSMVMSDGVLTPAQSVLGAVQGLNVATTVSNGVVVGVTCAILIVLFFVQPLGTGRLGSIFAPIVIIWLGMTGGVGIYNLVKYDWRVLRAFAPNESFQFLIRNGHDGWLALASTLLAISGCEALFADLGAFSMRAIQLSWIGYCLPMLLLTYCGQAAYISVNADAYSNPVFLTAPNGMVIPLLVFAVLAAIVASQAIITATFQLLAQITKLSYFPTIKIIHTSKVYHNQLFVPLVNWLLMIGTVLIAAIYNNTTSLGNAYGVCVMFVTFFDTCMVTLVAMIVWRFPWWVVFIPSLAIACIDCTLLSAALTKVPAGGWFTITLAIILASVFILWRFGKEQQWTAEAKDRLPISKFVREKDGKYHLVQYNDEEISQSRGFGVFFDKVGDKTPIVFSQFMEKMVVLPEVSVFLNLRAVEKPSVPDDERYWVSKMKLPNCYRIVVRHGYMDEVISPDLAQVVFTQLKRHILARTVHQPGSTPQDTGEVTNIDPNSDEKAVNSSNTAEQSKTPIHDDNVEVTKAITYLENAYASRVLYVVGKEDMNIGKCPLWRRVLLSIFLFIRYNTRNKMANLPLPRDRLVEIGFVKEI